MYMEVCKVSYWSILIQGALQMIGVPPYVSGPILTLVTGGSPTDMLLSMIPGGKGVKGGSILLGMLKGGGIFRKVKGFLRSGGMCKALSSLFKKLVLREH